MEDQTNMTSDTEEKKKKTNSKDAGLVHDAELSLIHI